MAGGKRRKVRWSEEAKREFRKLLEYYFERNRSDRYCVYLRKLVADKLERIRLFPESGEMVPYDTARFVVVENSVLIYEIADDAILVHAFRDARREPE